MTNVRCTAVEGRGFSLASQAALKGRPPHAVRSTQSLLRRALLVVTSVVTAGCDGPQSSLVPAGRDAERITQLFTVMSVGSLIVWAAVVIIAVYTIRVRGPHSPRAANLLIVGGGVALPTVVLGALLAYGLPAVPAVLALPEDRSLVIRVTGKQWWWRVQYVTANRTIETANEVHLAVGRRVELQLTSPDVIHSFWVPPLAGKMDMIPGRLTKLALEPTRTGVFRGACAEYCGASHALMAFDVVVVQPAEFDAWLMAQAESVQLSAAPLAAQGARAFLANGCSACHTIRGTPAAGRIGPDLTHVGGRVHIGAATLPKNPEAFVRWITETDQIKPGVHMPAFRALPSDDLRAIAWYLDSLR